MGGSVGKRMGRRRKGVGVGVRVMKPDISVLARLSMSHCGCRADVADAASLGLDDVDGGDGGR